MKTLLHICCAPCANQPIEVLRTDGIEVTGFWYNPRSTRSRSTGPGATAWGNMPKPSTCRSS